MLSSPAAGVQTPSAAATDWSLAKRLGFRCVFLYLALYNIPFPTGAIPETEALEGAYEDGWHPIVQWIGARVLHLAQPITIFPGGSGDTTYNYVQLLCYGALTLLTVLLWSILDSRLRRYDVLIDWLRIFVRCALAYSMILYGLHKVFKLQFPALDANLWNGSPLQQAGDATARRWSQVATPTAVAGSGTPTRPRSSLAFNGSRG